MGGGEGDKKKGTSPGRVPAIPPPVSTKELESKLMTKQQFKDLPLDERTEELFARLLDVVPINSKVKT